MTKAIQIVMVRQKYGYKVLNEFANENCDLFR